MMTKRHQPRTVNTVNIVNTVIRNLLLVCLAAGGCAGLCGCRDEGPSIDRHVTTHLAVRF